MGAISRLKTRTAGKISACGSFLYAGMLDLSFWLEPCLTGTRPQVYRPRPWVGLAVIGLLVCGLVFVGMASVEVVRAILPAQREPTP